MTGLGPSASRISIVIADTADDADGRRIAAALADDIAAKFGPADAQTVSLRARDADGALIGGLNGLVHWKWLYIRHLWVAESARRAGVGRRLLDAAESEARARGCVGLYIDTFERGVAEFYGRAGFEECGEISNFPPGGARVFLRKSLTV